MAGNAVIGLRIIGVLNILYFLPGAAFLLFNVFGFRFGRLSPAERWPFVILLLVNGVFLVWLLFSAIMLLMLNRKARAVSNWLFCLELAYALVCLFALPTSVAGFGAVANVSIALQIFTGYPIIALIVVNKSRGGFKESVSELPLAPST